MPDAVTFYFVLSAWNRHLACRLFGRGNMFLKKNHLTKNWIASARRHWAVVGEVLVQRTRFGIVRKIFNVFR
jgi:hypothetical protein